MHGSPLGIDDGEYAKKSYGYSYPPFTVPEEVYLTFKETFVKRGKEAYEAYVKDNKEYSLKYQNEANFFNEVSNNDVKSYVFKEIPKYAEDFSDSTRKESGAMLVLLNKQIKNLIGGSADVAHSVMTLLPDEKDYSPNCRNGRNVNFGIREFAMACIQNGMLLHGGLRTYAGCFLVFADYLKPAIRLAALSKLPAIYLFSHDSIAVGEDGPTHQPIEQLAMLRSIPNTDVIRPCDAREVAAAWKLALESTTTPTCLILSRQSLPMIENTSYEGVKKGGYIVSSEEKHADFVIVATGSEVSLAVDAQKKLREKGIDTRVVSMPNTNAFIRQDYQYQKSVLGEDYDRIICVEMLSSFGWHRFGRHTMSIDTFGASAPDKDVIKKFGFTSDALVNRISILLNK